MITRTRLMLGGAVLALLAVIAIGGAVVWYSVLRDDAPSSVSLSEAVSSVDGGQGAPADAEELAGRWTLAPGGDSFTGYRVREELANVGAFTAVGRTRDLTASLSFDGSAITEVAVEANLTALQSDDSRRDNALRRQALETERFPTATFVLTQPIALDGVPEEGVPIAATATGDLTLHGVTKSVAIPLQGQRTGGNVVVVGSLDILFADYGIASPRSFNVLSVEDRGVMEFQLIFAKESTEG